MALDKKAVTEVLEQIAAFLELKGENPFRVRAFHTAARAIAALPGALAEALDDGSLAATKGVGPATLQIVQELVRTGRLDKATNLVGNIRRNKPFITVSRESTWPTGHTPTMAEPYLSAYLEDLRKAGLPETAPPL